MSAVQPIPKQVVTFGVFELDLTSKELRKHGLRVKLQDQPFRVLEILLERPKELVGREELQRRVWPADTFVDFDKGLYNAIKKLREVLGDAAVTPRYIETIPKRGYRFICPVSVPQPEPIPEAASDEVRSQESSSGIDNRPWQRVLWRVAALCALFSALGILWIVEGRHDTALSAPAGSGGAFSITVDPIDNKILAYYRGRDSNLYQLIWPWDPKQWSQLTGSQSRPPAMQDSGLASYVNTITKRPEVFYIVRDTRHIEQLDLLGVVPLDLNLATGAGPAAPGSGLAGFVDECAGTDNVFYVGADRHVHVLMWSRAAGWSAQDLTSQTHALEVVGTAITGHILNIAAEVFYFGTDHQVHEFWRWSGCPNESHFDGWHSTNVHRQVGTDLPAAMEGSVLVGFYNPESDQDDIFFVDIRRHVTNFVYTSKSQWQAIDVTNMAGTTPSGSAMAASLMNPKMRLNSLFFEDVNGNIHVLTAQWGPHAEWSEPSKASLNAQAGNCLGSKAQAPPATPRSPIATDTNVVLGNDEVLYQGTDLHLYQLQKDNESWSCADVTTLSGAPQPEQ